MTLPFEAASNAPERDGDGGTRPVLRIWRSALRWLIVGAFVLRATLSVLDVESVTNDSVRSISPFSPIGFGSTSAAWPLVWGTLALVCGLALATRIRIGWLLAFAVGAGYFFEGIADVTLLLDSTGNLLDAGGTILVGLVLPILVLSSLLSIRESYLPTSRRIHLPHHPGVPHPGLPHPGLPHPGLPHAGVPHRPGPDGPSAHNRHPGTRP